MAVNIINQPKPYIPLTQQPDDTTTDDASGAKATGSKQSPSDIVDALGSAPVLKASGVSPTAGDLPNTGGDQTPLGAQGAVKGYFESSKNFSIAQAVSILSDSYANQVLSSGKLGANMGRLEQDAALRKVQDAITQTKNERKSTISSFVTQSVGVLAGVAAAGWGASLSNQATASSQAFGAGIASLAGSASQLTNSLADVINKSTPMGYQYKADQAMLQGKMDEVTQSQFKSLGDQFNTSRDDAKKRAQSLIDLEAQVRTGQSQTSTSISQNSGQ